MTNSEARKRVSERGRKLRVGIDLDGVCYDFAASVRHLLNELDKPGDYPEPTRWEFYEDWGMTLPQFLDLCDAGVNAGIIFSHGDPYPGVQDAFRNIKAAGHTIHIVTDRSFGEPGASQAATIEWLAKNELPYDSITFTADKTVAKVDTMVDDKPSNYHALVGAGVDTYLLTQAWNQHVNTSKRVLDLLHYSEVIA